MDEIIWQYEHGGFGNWMKSRDAAIDSIMALQSEVELAKTATPPGAEVVPEGTLELLGKICARFREIEYQHELNHPHIGDGILYEMLEDLSNTLTDPRAHRTRGRVPAYVQGGKGPRMSTYNNLGVKGAIVVLESILERYDAPLPKTVEGVQEVFRVIKRDCQCALNFCKAEAANHIADAGKMVKVGDFTLSNDPPIEGKIWINRESGEGGSFGLAKFEAHIEAFYQEHF